MSNLARAILLGALLVSHASVRSEEIGSSAIAALDARQTVVIANRNVPESIPLARHYMDVRGIPSNHLCVLDLPVGETIARRIYDKRLAEPLRAFLREQGLVEQVRRDVDESRPGQSGWRTVRNSVRYLVSVYGVPLRIAGVRPFWVEKANRLIRNSQLRDGAAVDSELACLLWRDYALEGSESNPWYNYVVWPRNEQQARHVLIAARLDGPGPGHVRRMIDDAVAAEATGLHGRAYVDMRSIQDPDYVMGDYWLSEAAERLKRIGWDVLIDPAERLFTRAHPMDDAAVYLGWYSEVAQGPFLREGFRFVPGAVAYHLHSSSARTLRSETAYWAGPLIAAGAAAVMGAVDEPYLSLTPDLQIFIDRLSAGFSFGESAYMAMRALSWQITVVGDPLYRPFPSRIEDPTFVLPEERDAATEWRVAAFMNRLASQQRLHQALLVGQRYLQAGESDVVREKMAELLAKNERMMDAFREYRAVFLNTDREDRAFRIARILGHIARFANGEEQADTIKQQALERWPDSPLKGFLEEGDQ